MNRFQKRACVENEELSKLEVRYQQNQLVVVLETGMLIKVNVHPGLLSKIWKREAKGFEFLVFIKQTKKGVYLGRILKDFFDLEGE